MDTHAAPVPHPSELSDGEVIAAVLAGDAQSFAIVVQRHNQTMFRACRAVLRNDHDAEDATQIAWVRVYRALATFRGESSFRTWLTRIAVHEASRLHGRGHVTEVLLEETTMDRSPDPENAAIDEELGRLLEREIEALPEGMRAVLVLRDVIELDTAETAACLGIAEQNVRVRLHRARQAVSARLDRTATATGEVWRFDGDRCARVLASVMAAIAP